MNRRTFIKSTAVGTAILMMPAGVRKSLLFAGSVALEDSFADPPNSSRAQTWWHWMNGNITADGITRDLEAMKQAGVGGFHIFQVSGVPKGAVEYGSEEHTGLLLHAAAEAQRLGLEFIMHNCPGWTSSGGPWITPEMSMQQLVWTETYVEGGTTIKMEIARPFTKRGYYRDAFVLAFPSLKGEEKAPTDSLVRLSSNSGPVDTDLLDESRLDGGISIYPPDDGSPGFLLMEFETPVEARSIAVYYTALGGGGGFGGGPSPWLEASEDNRNFYKVSDIGKFGGLNYSGMTSTGVNAPLIAGFKAAKAKYFRLQLPSPCVISDVKLSAADRIREWTHKSNCMIKRGATVDAYDVPFLPTEIESAAMAIPVESVLDLASFMDSTGTLNWKAPAGNWTILRLGHTAIGVENHPAADGGGGLECDKYSREALTFHFNHFFGKLLPKLESLAAKGVAGALIDSFEVNFQNWTGDFPAEFQKRRGYDLKKYMPAMTGRVVGDADISDRFLWDIRRTQADLIADHYYGQLSTLCHERGMVTLAEPYTGGPFEEMQIGLRIDRPMGEFWLGGGRSRAGCRPVKLAASIAHTGGKSIVGAESFSGMPDFSKWQEYPYAMKAQGDYMYTLGLNQLVFHRYAHQPHPSAAPGMTMGQWGCHFERTNTWWAKAGPWLDYVARCQHMLRQGIYVADIAYFIGENAPLSNPWGEDLQPAAPEGVHYDTVSSEIILERMKVKNNRIILPDGMQYKILVLPDRKTMGLDVLTKVSELVSQGMFLYGPRPERTPGLSGLPSADRQLQRIADTLWGQIDGESKTENSFGQGKVFWGGSFEEILEKCDISADFSYSAGNGDAAINFIHRKTGDLDIYFVSNLRRRPENLVCKFKVDQGRPEFWDPETGETAPAPLFDMQDGFTRMPLSLAHAGSVFVVFRRGGSSASNGGYHSVSKDGRRVAGTENFPGASKGIYPSIVNNFSIGLWAKPEIDFPLSGRFIFGSPTNMAIYPPDGQQLYGEGHSCCGLAIGRNGVVVYERSDGEMQACLSVRMPVSGWTYIAVNYESGVPSLFVNGEFCLKGKFGGTKVHPGVGEAYQTDGAAYFEGEMCEPEVFSSPLSIKKMKEFLADGVPLPEDPTVLECRTGYNGKLLFWENGKYSFKTTGGKASTINISGIQGKSPIDGPWAVSFPPNLGAPSEIILPSLLSLHRHTEDGVKYFSGTAVYSNSFTVRPSDIKKDTRVFIDLGRVEVLAQVKINGRDNGICWKPPFRIDITDSVRPGENHVEISVTNLWPNRLIGDEHLPIEDEFEPGTDPNFQNADKEEIIGVIKKFPEWYVQGLPKPAGGRVTFSAYKHYHKKSPLLESGLLGPVAIRMAVIQKLA